jgi:hypothetical protein
MEQIEPVKSKEGTKKNKSTLTPEEKKERQKIFSKRSYDKYIATHGRVRPHKKTAKQQDAQKQKLEEKQLVEEYLFLKKALKPLTEKKTRGKMTEERKQLLKELKETLTSEEYKKKRKEIYNKENADKIKEQKLLYYYENSARINKERAERERKKRQQESLSENNMNPGPDAFDTYVPSQEDDANSSVYEEYFSDIEEEDANSALGKRDHSESPMSENKRANMNPGPDAFETYVPSHEYNANSSVYEDYFSDIENANIELEHPESHAYKRGNGLDEFDMDDLNALDVDGGKKPRKRRNRKTKKNKKKHLIIMMNNYIKDCQINADRKDKKKKNTTDTRRKRII